MLRSNIIEAIEYFKHQGFRVKLASGDVKRAVKLVREKLKLDFAYASLKPIDKARVIREMQSNGPLPIYNRKPRPSGRGGGQLEELFSDIENKNGIL